LGEENVKHGLLKCYGAKHWRDELVCSKRIVNVIVSCEKVLDYTDVTEIKRGGRYLYKIRCEWENVNRRGSYRGCRLIESKTQKIIGQARKDYNGAETAV
jgi:hypothetical protein